jgi:1-acyl-sn-glycerol-3-phosphate acyltransferase
MVAFNLLRQPYEAVTSASKAHPITSYLSPWLIPIAYPLICQFVLPFYFKRIEVIGQDNLPKTGPVILAPTHRTRWDSLVVGCVAGRWATGRDLRFMVTSDEVKGLQGWFIRRLGGFPVNPRQPAIASLRHGVEILHNQQALVIFPEGGIFRDNSVHMLKPGLARLALQAEASKPGLGVKVVPLTLNYSEAFVRRGSKVIVNIGKPLYVSDYHQGTTKQSAQKLTTDLEDTLKHLIKL